MPPKNNLELKKNQFKCIVPECRSTTSSNLAKLHSFPWRDMPRAQKWIRAVGRYDLLGAPPKALLRLRVCDLHFDKKLHRGKNMKLWDNSAVPTLKLDTVKRDPVKKETVVKKETIVKKATVKKRKANNKNNKMPAIKIKKEKMEPVTNGHSSADSSAEPSAASAAAAAAPAAATPAGTAIRLPRELARFLALRDALQARNGARRGFDRPYCALALRLRVACPEAYRVLWRSLRLPPPALLPRVDLGVGAGLDSDLIRCFEAKMEALDPRDRECVLCLDEVELARRLFYVVNKDEIVGLEEIDGEMGVEPAARAIVVAARGLRGGWTQPLACFALGERCDAARLVAPLRRLVVHALYGRARCAVRAIVAGLGPTFAELAAALGATVESPFVLDAAPRRRVCFLHDPEQLLLTLRDTLIAYDVRFRDPATGAELVASWRDVEELHREDSARALRLLPELTRARVRPTPRESLLERHAAALFTRRVAAQLAAGARAGSARLLLLAADVRRALRAPRVRDLARVASATAALAAALRDMRIVSPDGAEHDAEVFVRALRVTLAGALHLLAEAGEERGAARDEPLRLARAGLRPLRRFIERAEGARGRVEPRELRRRFRRWAMRRLLAPVAAVGARPEDDLAALLRRAEAPEPQPAARAAGLALGSLQHRVDVRRGRSAGAVWAALLHELRRAHGCAAFVRWARTAGRGARLVRALDAGFKRALAERGPNAAGARALAAVAAALAERAPCACFPRDTFARLFVRFRLRAALQTCNRALRGEPLPEAARWLSL